MGKVGKGLFSSIVISVALLAISFQAIGFFSHAWLRLRVHNLGPLISGIMGKSDIPGMTDMSRLTDMLSPKNTGLPGIDGDKTSGNPFGDAASGNPFSEIMAMGMDPMEMVKSLEMSQSVGLWTGMYSDIAVCMDILGKQRCIAIGLIGWDDLFDMAEKINPNGKTWDVDLMAEKVLSTMAAVFAVFGIIALFLFISSEIDKGMRCKAILCATSWGLSAVLVLMAVGLGTDQSNGYLEKIGANPMQTSMGVDIVMMQFPWAILMSGIGGFLSLIVVLAVVMRACKLADYDMSGSWMEFRNHTV